MPALTPPDMLSRLLLLFAGLAMALGGLWMFEGESGREFVVMVGSDGTRSRAQEIEEPRSFVRPSRREWEKGTRDRNVGVRWKSEGPREGGSIQSSGLHRQYANQVVARAVLLSPDAGPKP